MATHYLKLFEGHDRFKNELNNPKERAISYGSNDEEKEYSSSDTELRAAPSNSESQIVNPEVRKFPSSNYEVQEAVEKRQQVQPHFNIPSVVNLSFVITKKKKNLN